MREKPKFGFVVEFVEDIEVAKSFYTDELGLEIERSHPQYVEFETFAIATGEPLIADVKEEIYWLVDDAQSMYETLSKSTEVCLYLQEVPFGKVFGVKSPDGRVRYILELASVRPSKEEK